MATSKPGSVIVDMPASLELRDSAKRWWLAGLLILAMMFCYAQRGALSIAAPAMIRELGLTTAVMGILLSAFSWTYSFLQVPAGYLVDRYGVRRPYAWLYGVSSLATAATGMVTGLVSLMAARMAVGVGQAGAFPASLRAVSNWFHDGERGLVTASYLTGVRLGQALINAVGVALLATFGWKTFFLLVGTIPLIWLLPWNIFLRRWEGPSTGLKAGTARPKAGVSIKARLRLLRNRDVLGIFLGYFAYDYVWFVFTNWLPGYLSLERKFQGAELGLYSSMPFLAMSVVILISGVVSDSLVRWGLNEVRVRKALIAAGLAASTLLVPAGFVQDRMTSVWLLTLSLCGLGICPPNTWTLTQAVCSRNIIGTVAGIQNFGGNVGGIIAPALTGFIVHQTNSFVMAFEVAAGIAVAGILAYWLLVTRRVEIEEQG